MFNIDNWSKGNEYYEERDSMIGCLSFSFYFLVMILLAVMCSCFTSCTTQKIEYRDRVVDNYITQVVHDTLREQSSDSVYYEVVTRHDTVFSTKYKERTKWRDRIIERHDTCWRDSIVTEYKETVKEVVKIPKIFWLSMIFSIICIIFVAVKAYVKWHKVI